MKKIKLIISMVIIFIFLNIPAYSQVNKIAQSGLQFLKIETGARAAAMGGAMTLAGYDAFAVFYNPSGLARMDNDISLMAGLTQWIADISYNSFSATYKYGEVGTFALHGTFADYGDIEGAQLDATSTTGYRKTGNIDVGAYAFGVSYARNLSEKFSVGGTVKYVGQNLGESKLNTGETKENKVTGFAFDFGTIFYPGWKSFGFGMSIRNFSAEFEYEKESFELPLTFNIGVSMNVMDLFDMQEETLLLSLDAVHPRDYTERIKVGAEYLLMDMVAIRAGYKTNHDIEGFSAGFGFFYEVSEIELKIDYSYSDVEFFDAVNRFTVGFVF
jgi:hypothetical protein